MGVRTIVLLGLTVALLVPASEAASRPLNLDRPLDQPAGPVAPFDVSSSPPDQPKTALREYEVFKIEFHRVETPFIIGIWIFFASLAKIGQFLFHQP